MLAHSTSTSYYFLTKRLFSTVLLFPLFFSLLQARVSLTLLGRTVSIDVPSSLLKPIEPEVPQDEAGWELPVRAGC